MELMTPAAISRQSEEADAMIAKLSQGTPLDEAPEEAAAADTPDQPSQPEVQDEAKEAVKVDDAELSFEKRYRILQGKYDAEVPRLSAQLRELREELARLKEAPPAEAKQEPPKKVESKRVDPDTLADFGPEVQSMAEAVNSLQEELALLRQENAQLRDGIEPVKQQVERTAQETKEQRFLQELSTMAPQYAEQNVDPVFLDWLAGEDDYDPDGRTRQEVLTAAAQRGNAKAVARYFNTFAQEHGKYGKGNEPAAPAQAKTPANIQPGTSRPGNPGTSQTEKRMWTADSIERFYRDVQVGKLDAQEAARLERDLFAAQKEGRIR